MWGEKRPAPIKPSGIFTGLRAKKLAWIAQNDPKLFRAIAVASTRMARGQPTIRAQAIASQQALWRKQRGLLNNS